MPQREMIVSAEWSVIGMHKRILYVLLIGFPAGMLWAAGLLFAEDLLCIEADVVRAADVVVVLGGEKQGRARRAAGFPRDVVVPYTPRADYFSALGSRPHLHTCTRAVPPGRAGRVVFSPRSVSDIRVSEDKLVRLALRHVAARQHVARLRDVHQYLLPLYGGVDRVWLHGFPQVLTET